jgi:hypothetical protein
VRLKGVIAVDNEPLYDTLVLPSSLTPGEYCWFATGVGGSIDTSVNSGGAKQRCETNVVNAGRLPEPERFEIVAFRLVPDFTANSKDWAKVLQRAYLEIRVGGGTTPMHRVPARIITSGTGFISSGASVSGIGAAVGWPNPSSILTFAPDTTVVIELNENFSVCLIVCSTQTLDGGSAVVPVQCVLEGYHAKGVRKG